MSVTLDLFCILRASRMLVNIFTYHRTVANFNTQCAKCVSKQFPSLKLNSHVYGADKRSVESMPKRCPANKLKHSSSPILPKTLPERTRNNSRKGYEACHTTFLFA